MRKCVNVLMVSLFLVLLSACANKQQPLPVEPKPQVLVLDLTAIAKATGRGAVIADKIEQANARLEQQLTDFKEKIEFRLREEKNKIKSKRDKEAQQHFQVLFVKAQQQMQRAQMQAKQKSQLYKAKLWQAFKNEIKPFAKQIAQSRDASIVRFVDASSLWHSRSVDITDVVIGLLPVATVSESETVIETP